MKRITVLGTCAFVTLACVPRAAAQVNVEVRPRDSAEQLVTDYLSGANKRVLEATGWPCPATDARRNDVFVRLSQAQLSDMQVQELAQRWAYVLGRCNDQRIGAWYRTHISVTRVGLTALALGLALGETTDSANLNAVRATLYRDDLSAEIRSEIAGVVRGATLAEVVGWLIDGIASGRAIPTAYLSNAMFRLPNDSRQHARERLLEVLVNGASSPGIAAVAIQILIGDLPTTGDPVWRARLSSELVRISDSPGAAASVRSMAREALVYVK